MFKKELLEFFLAEADDLIGQLEKGFLELEQNPSDITGVQELFRSAHTLKGSAALVKLNTLSKIAHKMEDALESVRETEIAVTKELVDWFLYALDSIKFLIEETTNGRPEKTESLNEISTAFQRVCPEKTGEHFENKKDTVLEEKAGPAVNKEEGGISSGAEEKESSLPRENVEEKRVSLRRKEDKEATSNFVKVNVDNLDKMMGLVGELTILKNFFMSGTEGVNNLKSEIEYACMRLLREVDDFDGRYAHSAPEKISFVDSLLEDFRELEFDRYDGINLFANSIKEIVSDVNEAITSISVFFEQFAKYTVRLDKVNMDFREIISASRMVETGKLFRRFTRIIRDLCAQTGKQVRFVVNGGDTRIDRTLDERLFTPLLHLVRNSFSHGIESPEERFAAGKPAEGSIALSAHRDGNMVIIDIQDDGGGINLEKVYQGAVKKGIIADGEEVTQARLLNVLFMPAFTTRDGIDMTSGRGVGLDAVRQIISEINGTISIASKEGKGTTFRIKLPLTLVVVNTVRFRAGGLEFSAPSSLIQEIVDIDITKYDKEKNSINLRGNETPLKDLCNLFNLKPRRSDTRAPIIVFNLFGGRETALLVDEITGHEDTVIESLGGFLEGLKYYSGFSISADAKLAPVINPVGLLETEIEEIEIVQVLETVEESRKSVLLVDDSLSVRKFASLILEQNGYKVLTAPNGLEALNLIDENHVDLIITDLEMPVMHGYELLGELKRRGLTDVIPAVVLTSRSSEKHREKATLLGAKGYITKPFEESTLVQGVSEYLKGRIASPSV